MAATGRIAIAQGAGAGARAVGPDHGGAPADAIGHGEVAELYAALSRRLRAIVRAVVPASEAVVDDACQVAWFRLIRHRRRVQRERVLAWLGATAVHEARRLMALRLRDASLEEELAERGEWRLDAHAREPDQLFEARETLRSLGAVTARQRRLVWLHAMGWSYAEIAQHEGCSLRTVQRQLLRAKRALRGPTAPSPACDACAPPG